MFSDGNNLQSIRPSLTKSTRNIKSSFWNIEFLISTNITRNKHNKSYDIWPKVLYHASEIQNTILANLLFFFLAISVYNYSPWCSVYLVIFGYEEGRDIHVLIFLASAKTSDTGIYFVWGPKKGIAKPAD